VKNIINLLTVRTDVTSVNKTINQVNLWMASPAHNNRGRYICFSNVHMCMETFDDEAYRDMVNHADMVVPDGRALVWAQKLLGFSKAQQVRGADLTLSLCEYAAQKNIPIGFYGATPLHLDNIAHNLHLHLPSLHIASAISPPFRPLTEEENQHFIQQINASGVKILFVGLGCPKQERWMAKHVDKVNCIMLGVGAAFDFIAEHKRHAPKFIQILGLEWLFRLSCEPKRLWKRYLKHNPRFIWHFFWQWRNYKKGVDLPEARYKNKY